MLHVKLHVGQYTGFGAISYCTCFEGIEFDLVYDPTFGMLGGYIARAIDCCGCSMDFLIQCGDVDGISLVFCISPCHSFNPLSDCVSLQCGGMRITYSNHSDGSFVSCNPFYAISSSQDNVNNTFPLINFAYAQGCYACSDDDTINTLMWFEVME